LWNSLQWLGKSRHPEARTYLLQLVESDKKNARYYRSLAAHAIVDSQDPTGLNASLRIVYGIDRGRVLIRQREREKSSLLDYGREIDLLREKLKSPNSAERKEAFGLLVRGQGSNYYNALLANVVIAALDGLKEDEGRRVFWIAAHAGPRLVDFCLKRVKTPQGVLLKEALVHLASSHDPRAVPAALDALRPNAFPPAREGVRVACLSAVFEAMGDYEMRAMIPPGWCDTSAIRGLLAFLERERDPVLWRPGKQAATILLLRADHKLRSSLQQRLNTMKEPRPATAPREEVEVF
jgi:hypothetical protein